MDSFWKSILGTVLGAASLIGAHYSSNWLANHTYRANRAPPMLAEVPKPAFTKVTVPNYFQHRTTLRLPHLYQSRH